MNIYEKLQTMRVEFQGMNVKKTGKNTYAGYEYYELEDIIPAINNLLLKHKVTSIICYNGTATLTLVNIEKPEEIVRFESPMSTAALKGCHEVQNLGAVQTYLRRYLYTTAFEIVESDVLDKTHVNNEPEKKQEPKPQNNGDSITSKQAGYIKKLFTERFGEDGEQELFNILIQSYGTENLNDLTKKQASELIGTVQK